MEFQNKFRKVVEDLLKVKVAISVALLYGIAFSFVVDDCFQQLHSYSKVVIVTSFIFTLILITYVVDLNLISLCQILSAGILGIFFGMEGFGYFLGRYGKEVCFPPVMWNNVFGFALIFVFSSAGLYFCFSNFNKKSQEKDEF